MTIGTKIRQLRDSKKISQSDLARRLGIGQTTLGFIESGDTKKIDFLIMDKICKEFEIDFNYFLEDKQITNIKANNGTIAYSVGTINNFPESIIEQVKLLVEDNKLKEIKIKELETLLEKKRY
jgi:transcriptional regulator with XRE-family HTH domain